MYFEVNLTKDGPYWLIEAPALDVMTQGKTKKEAVVMLKDAIELLADQKNFEVEVILTKSNNYFTANNQEALIALLLRRQRQKSGLTLQEIAGRLGSKSPNTFARYEQGKANPTLSKFVELIEAINPESAPILKFS
jgi:predicted RNase H-like HicB family nuclease/DNA-binding XRE family transcriptional regulator